MSMPSEQHESGTQRSDQTATDQSILKLQGALTVSDAERLYQTVGAAIQDYGCAGIDISDVVHLDLAAMQILISAVRDGIAEFRTDGNSVNADVLRQFQIAGQAHLLMDA